MKKRNLKKTVLLAAVTIGLSLGIGVASASAQTVKVNAKNFPDTHFRNWIQKNIVKSKTKHTLTQKMLNTKKMIIWGGNEDIRSIKGIRFFKKLEVLTVSYQPNFKGIQDFRSLKKLKRLDVSYNKHLSSINIKGLDDLRYLEFSGSYFSQLDLSTNSNLHYILGSWDEPYQTNDSEIFVRDLKVGMTISWKELGYSKQPRLAPIIFSDGTQGFVGSMWTTKSSKHWTKVSQGFKLSSKNNKYSDYGQFSFNLDCGIKTWYSVPNYSWSDFLLKSDFKKEPYIISRQFSVWTFHSSDIVLSQNKSKVIKVDTKSIWSADTTHTISYRLMSGKGIVNLSKKGKVTALKKGTAKIAVTVHLASHKVAKEVNTKNNVRLGNVGTKVISVKVK